MEFGMFCEEVDWGLFVWSGILAGDWLGGRTDGCGVFEGSGEKCGSDSCERSSGFLCN